MKCNCDRYGKLLSDIRFAYLCVYIALTAITYAIPVSKMEIPGLGALYTFFGVVGGALLVINLLYRQVIFTPKNCSLVILFFVAMIASCVSNIRYGFSENVKTLIWQAIQMFLMASIDTRQPAERHKKQLRILMEIFSVIWLIWAGWSLVQYIQQYGKHIFLKEFQDYKLMGFAEGRLFGVFKDPNYGALCSVAAIVCAVVCILMGKKSVGNAIYHGIQIFVQACYIILSGSRSIQLGILFAVVLLAGLLGWRYFETRLKKVRWKVIACVLMVVFAFSASNVVWSVWKTGLSYLPGAYTAITQSGQDSPDQIPDVDLNRSDVVGEDADITNNRAKIWSNYVKVLFSTPLFGTSPRNVLAYTTEHFPHMYVVQKQYSVHNSYLVLFVATGLVGGGIMVLWLALVAAEVAGYLIRRRNSGDKQYNVILVMTLFLVVCAVAALPLQFIFFTNSIYDVLFWVVLGYVRGLVQMAEPERYEKKPLPYRLVRKLLKQAEN